MRINIVYTILVIIKSKTYLGYGADDNGNVYSFWNRVPNTLSDWHIDYSKPKILKPTYRLEKGRNQIRPCLYIKSSSKKRHKILVAKIVADCFLGPSNLIVRHLNDISTDNRPVNLIYGTHKLNTQDRQRNQLLDFCIEDYKKLKQENIELKIQLEALKQIINKEII